MRGIVEGAWMVGLLALGADGAAREHAAAEAPQVARDTATADAWGTAFTFGPPGGYVVGGAVTVLERPDLGVVLTDDRGYFRFDGLVVGEDATFVLRAEGYETTQTPTLTVPAGGLDQLTFQSPVLELFRALSLVVRIVPDPRMCQIAATVVQAGADPYAVPIGEPGATVSIDPPLDPRQGPVYFEYFSDAFILPLRHLTETSIDGGVLFLNVPPGEYVLRAHKEGVEFSEARITCRPGVTVNAAPPYGLMAQ